MTRTLKLEAPIEHDGKQISELVFREPSGGELTREALNWASEGKTRSGDQAFAFAALCCGVPVAALDTMSASDAIALIRVVQEMGADSGAPLEQTPKD